MKLYIAKKVNLKSSRSKGKKQTAFVAHSSIAGAAEQGVTPSSEPLARLSVCLPAQVDTDLFQGTRVVGFRHTACPRAAPPLPKLNIVQVQQRGRTGQDCIYPSPPPHPYPHLARAVCTDLPDLLCQPVSILATPWEAEGLE